MAQFRILIGRTNVINSDYLRTFKTIIIWYLKHFKPGLFFQNIFLKHSYFFVTFGYTNRL